MFSVISSIGELILADLQFGELEYFATRPMTIQSDVLRASLFFNRITSLYLSISVKEGRSVYLDKKSLYATEENLVKQAVSDPKKHFKDYLACMKKMHESSKRVAKEKTAEAFKQWIESIAGTFGPIVLPFAIERLVEPVLKEKLPKLYELIARPSKLNDFEKMRLGIIELALSGDERLAKKLAKKFYWYNEYSFIEPFLDEKYFLEQAKLLSREKAEEEKKNLLSKTKPKLRIKDKQLKNMAMLAHAYTLLRTDRIDQWKKAEARIRKFYSFLSKKTKLSYEDVLRLTNKEIIDFLEKGVLPLSEIEKRKEVFVYYFDGKDNFLYGQQAEAAISKITSFVSKEIKGVTACAGEAKGKAMIIRSKNDLGKFQVGYILVAKHTMPDYLSAMSKAAAIITDEGGMTSHAAIVSRELKKPCIVGAKNATVLLKDGDLVKVDASKGIAKKLVD